MNELYAPHVIFVIHCDKNNKKNLFCPMDFTKRIQRFKGYILIYLYKSVLFNHLEVRIDAAIHMSKGL